MGSTARYESCHTSTINRSIRSAVPITSKCAGFYVILSFAHVVSQKNLWEHCILNLDDISLECLYGNLRKYGHLISTITLRGSCNRRLCEYLYYFIRIYCKHLLFINCYELPYLFPLGPEARAFSIPFPSSASVYSTLQQTNERYMMFSINDGISQDVETHGQCLGGFMQSVWQFEISNHIQPGFSATFCCYINNFAVGSFTLNDFTVASSYAINMMYPIPCCSLRQRRSCLTLCIRCKNQLPFGAGYVRFSSVGRVSFLKGFADVKYIDRSVPAYQVV